MDINDLKSIHKEAMLELHGIVGTNVKVYYNDGTMGIVRATISDSNSDSYINDQYIGRYNIYFHIIKQNLIDKGYPIKNFKSVEYNRKVYGVESEKDTSALGNTVTLECKNIG